MSIFCANNATGYSDSCVSRAAVLAGIALLGASGLALWAGYHLGQSQGQGAQVVETSGEVHSLLAQERRLIAEAKAEQRAHLDALALKIAELQAHMMRLDALGDRLVDAGNLDRDEFDFTNPPPQGGIDDTLPGENVSAAELTTDMAHIAAALADREVKLAALEHVLMNRDLMAEVRPSGRPVEKGWMSSGFGKRTDPFKGKRSFHRGLDFAGKRGSNVVAVASGVVVRSELASGFGNLVEIKHADGYSTLYAHNKENKVKVGQVVSKGETIALLGSTGRSSGPHVHFEVHRNGKVIDPLRYVRSH